MKSSTLPCSDDRLQQLLFADEGTEAFAQALQHLESCAACRARFDELAADREHWSEARRMLVLDDTDRLIAEEEAARSWSVSGHRHPPKAWTESMVRQLLAPASHPEMLGRIGRYEVERCIGSGGMGVVFKAFDVELNRPVAVKLLAPHLAGSGAARSRFAREARAAAAVVDEHVVAIHNVESEGESPFLVMQFVPGESLQSRIDRNGPLGVCEVLRIAMQTARGLAAAHSQGLIHRDVKPSNILLEEGIDHALLADFGLARAGDDANLTHTGYYPGTPQYMSPEQARGEAVDAASDLFSLGSVIYAMCTGRPPFRAETSYGALRRITDTEPRPIREINPAVPDWLGGIVARLMSKRPEDRFGSAGEVAELLEDCLAHVQQPTTVPLPPRLPKQPRGGRGVSSSRRWRWAKYLAQAGCAMAMAFAGLLIVLELNKGTLTIESEVDDVAVRITKADEVVERMRVTRTGAAVRIAAGKYVVELEDGFEGVAVQNGSVELLRGGRKVVTIVQKADAAATSPSDAGAREHIRRIVASLLRGAGERPSSLADHARKLNERLSGDGAEAEADNIVFNVKQDRALVVTTEVRLREPEPDGRASGHLVLMIEKQGNRWNVADIDFETRGGARQKIRQFLLRQAEGGGGEPEAKDEATAGSFEKPPLWNTFGVTPGPVSPVTAKVLEWIGLHVRPILKEQFRGKNVFAKHAGGLDVTFVQTHGPAEKAGLHEVDIVVSLQDQPTLRLGDLDAAVGVAVEQMTRGDTDYLQFQVLRSGQTVRVNVPFPVRQLDGESPSAGTDDVRKRPVPDAEETGSELRINETPTRTVSLGAAVGSIAYSPDGALIAVAAGDAIYLLDAPTGRTLQTLEGHADRVWSLAFSANGRLLGSSSRDRTLRFWRVETGQQYGEAVEQRREVRSIAFSPAAGFLAAAPDDGPDYLIEFWQSTGAKVGSLKGATGTVQAIEFSPASDYLASGEADGKLHVWDVRRGQVRWVGDHPRSVSSVRFSRSGNWIASGGRAGEVRLWSASDGWLLWRSRLPDGSGAEVLEWHDDGRSLLFGLRDGTIGVIDAASGKVVQRFQAHDGAASHLALSPNGRRLVSGGSDDDAVKFWAVAVPRAEHDAALDGVPIQKDPPLSPGVSEARPRAPAQTRPAAMSAALSRILRLEESADQHEALTTEYCRTLLEAADQYQAFYREYRAHMGGLYARLYEARCYQKQQKYEKAIEILEDLKEHLGTGREWNDLRASAARMLLSCRGELKESEGR